MEFRVIEKADQELAFEIVGEDHTFMNVLKGSLLDTDVVATATYDMNPDQSGGHTDPILTFKTDDRDPLAALEAAASRIKDESEAFLSAYEAAA
jgi:DNA-directed RNA polymerase subunit L